MPSQINLEPCVPRIGKLPFFPTIFMSANRAEAPVFDVRPVPIANHLPALKTSNFMVFPAFAAPVSTIICTDLAVKLTREASHERDFAGALAWVVGTAPRRL